MSIFKKNANETAYVGGKKHWADVIKNSASGDLLIWRQPEEDFNTNSTLIVMPGEEAIFVKGGKVEQVFENGTYQLSTNNYPFISRLRTALTGGISTFNCVVFFVRKADSRELRWGTETPIQVRDKVWGVRTDVKARAVYKVRIENPAKFLEKMVGNNTDWEFQEDLDYYFAGQFQGKIKSAVSKYLNALNQELIGIDAYMDELSEQIQPYIDEALSDYGLKCVNFTLAALDVDNTKYDQIDKSQVELIRRQRGYQGDKAGLDILGKDWARVQGVEIMKDIANNQSSGSAAATGAGIGMGIGAASAFGTMAQQIFAPVTNAPAGAPQTAAPAPQPAAQQESDPIEVLGKLKKMLDAGLIEQAEYDSKKAEILSKM